MKTIYRVAVGLEVVLVVLSILLSAIVIIVMTVLPANGLVLSDNFSGQSMSPMRAL